MTASSVDPTLCMSRPRGEMLDTSTVILLGRVDNPAYLPARKAHLQQAETDFEAIAFDGEAARAFGTMAATLRASGREPVARAYDAAIAACAIAHGLPLYTCNPNDFDAIPQLEVRPVPHPDQAP